MRNQKNNRSRKIGAFAALLLFSNIVLADLLEEHARLMEVAIREKDNKRVAKLLATPYIDPTGYEYMRAGKRVQFTSFLNFALFHGNDDAAVQILLAGANYNKLKSYNVEFSWNFFWSAMKVVPPQNRERLFNTLLSTSFHPLHSNTLSYMLSSFLVIWGSASSDAEFEGMVDVLKSKNFTVKPAIDASPNFSWSLMGAVFSTMKDTHIDKALEIMDIYTLDRHRNVALNVMLFECEARCEERQFLWLERYIAKDPGNSMIRNGLGFGPYDFVYLVSVNPVCVRRGGPSNAPKRQALALMEAKYGPSKNWTPGYCNPRGGCACIEPRR